MSKNFQSDSRQHLFPIKVLACFFGLLLGLIILTPSASMQSDSATVSSNANMRVNGNYRPAPEPPKSTIRGRVIYADTGSPVRRAGLMLLPTKGAGGGGRENAGLTNELGEFELKNIPEGRYFVSVNIPGVVTPFSSLSNFERVGSMQNSPELADMMRDFQEVVVNGITDVDVTIAARRGAAITGRIAYADGESAIGVRVEILRKKDGRYSAVIPNVSDVFGAIFGGAAGGLKTDDRGVFRIAGLPAGEYIVRVVENVLHGDKGNGRDDEMMALTGFNPTSMVNTYYPNTGDVKKAEIIKIELGQEHPEVNITIPNRTLHTISGIIVNKATRQPIKGARVSLKSDDDVNSMFGSLPEFGSRNQTDEQGRWNYKQLPPGKYTVTVQPPYDYESPEERGQSKAKSPKFARLEKEIVIEEKDLSELVFELGYGAIISGTISFDNQQTLPSSISITAAEENKKFAESVNLFTQYSNDGKPIPAKIQDFKIEGVPNGKVFLRVSNRSYGEETKEEFYVKTINFNGKEISNAALEAKEGEELKGVQIVLSKDVGKLKGRVTKTDKTPVSGAKIFLIATDKSKWNSPNAELFTSTSSDGEFEISGAPGEYYVVFQKDEEAQNAEDETKTLMEKRRAYYEKETANAQKATIKAKETETLTLIFPE